MTVANGSAIGPYHVVSWLGAGGMGEVYRARDPRLDREVAIKVIAEAFATDAGRVRRFEQEAQAAGKLNHPNILAVYDVGAHQGAPYIVSELLEGESLRDRVRGGALPLRKANDYARQIAEGLAAAHDKSIAHRDLKPENIFITNDGRLKILDFGLAKLTQPSDQQATRPETEPGSVMGTAGYMSPEQVRGEPVDARSDLFSFGTIYHEMITGQSPFRRDSPVETMAAILNEDPAPPLADTVPPAIDRIVSRCLEKSREARFQSARDLAFGLEFLSGGSASAIAPAASTPAPWRDPRLVVAVASAAAAIAATAMLWQARSAPVPAEPLRMTSDLGAGVLLPQTALQFGDLADISRDGSLMVFAAAKSAEDGTDVLYVRSLNDLQARPVIGTDRAELPFLSPDGRWIAFFVGNQLRKVAVNGGPIQTLADVQDVRGGWWGSDGTIVYAPDRVAGSAIWQIPADGGTPSPITTLDNGEAIHVFPQTLPDGKGVLFTSSDMPGVYNDSNLVVQSPSTGEKKVVHRGGYHGRYVPSGHLLFIHDGALMAAPFDLDRLEVTRPPVPVVTGLRTNTITGGAQFSVSDTGVLAYFPGPGVGGDTALQVMDRQGVLTPIKGGAGSWNDVRFSPDGRRLVFGVQARRPEVWVYDLALETGHRLTDDAAFYSKPLWSPDGRRVVFSARTEKQPMNLAWRNADASGSITRLTTGTKNQIASAWHPSGKFLVVEDFASEADIDLLLLPIEGDEASGLRAGTPSLLVGGARRQFDAAFSPDGKWLAYVSDESGRFDVFVRPFPESGGRWQVSNSFAMAPTWSRGRSEIVYAAQGQLMVAPFTIAGRNFNAEKPRPWSEGWVAFRGTARMYDLHPDGNRVALAPSPSQRAMDATRLDKIVLVFNFFEELRRLTAEQR